LGLVKIFDNDPNGLCHSTENSEEPKLEIHAYHEFHTKQAKLPPTGVIFTQTACL
jgi:hypothetical protein